VPLLKQYEKTKSADIKEIYGKDHAESFLLLAQDRTSAFVMDDILLAGQIANSDKPGDYMIIPESLRQEPYSMMIRKDDTQFKALVDKTIGGVMKSGEIDKIYSKWFLNPVPPKNINMNFAMTPPIREAFKNPNDKGVQ
jgi:glutamate/aspartate transport system substrate-binding protein